MKRFILPLLLLLLVGAAFAVESEPSEIVGYVKYDIVAGNNMVAIPMECPWDWASDLGMELGEGVVDQISYWDQASQSFFGAADLGGFWDGDFDLDSHMALMVYSYEPMNMYSIGNLPATDPLYNLVAGNNTVMIPLNRSDLGWASDLGMEMGEGIVDQVSFWDTGSQSFFGAADLGGFWDGDFDLDIAMPLMVYSYEPMSWPGRGIIQNNNFNSRN